ncbi:MAG: mercuric reductase [Planctomycetota bacterium]|nr:MAG: mercuric reductase [Planctomycetota bacterium]
MRTERADLVVVGGGAAGFAAAIGAHELGAQVVLVHAGTIGGTCVNVGCVPSKTLIRAAEAHHRAARSRFRGIETSSRVRDFAAVIVHKEELVASLRQAKYVDVLASYDRVRLVQGRAEFRAPDTVLVDGQAFSAPRVIVATGAQPWLPPIPGLAAAEPLTSTSAFELRRLPRSLLVLGGRYVALECAQMLARLGARVTLLQRSEHLLPPEDEDLTERLAHHLREEGIEVVTGVEIERVGRQGEQVVLQARVRGEPRRFAAEGVLCATGRRPQTEGLGLERVGVRLGEEDGRLLVDEYLASSVPGIYGAGDVIGEPAFVYTAAYEGALAARNALEGNRERRDYTALPWVIFTDPQLAGVGLNEKQARAQGIDVEVARLELAEVPRAIVARDTRGFIKLIKRRGSDALLGARVLAPEGGEQIMEAALAIRHRIGVSELAAAFHPYLTQGEGIKLCALSFTREVRRLSCCAA